MTWDKARERCLQQGGDLAIVDSEVKRQTIARHLTEIDNLFPDVNIQAFIGIRKLGRWQWLGGRSILGNIWHSGHPHVLWSGECGALAKISLEWKLLQTSCFYSLGFVCETHDSKYICMYGQCIIVLFLMSTSLFFDIIYLGSYKPLGKLIFAFN